MTLLRTTQSMTDSHPYCAAYAEQSQILSLPSVHCCIVEIVWCSSTTLKDKEHSSSSHHDLDLYFFSFSAFDIYWHMWKKGQVAKLAMKQKNQKITIAQLRNMIKSVTGGEREARGRGVVNPPPWTRDCEEQWSTLCLTKQELGSGQYPSG